MDIRAHQQIIYWINRILTISSKRPTSNSTYTCMHWQLVSMRCSIECMATWGAHVSSPLFYSFFILYFFFSSILFIVLNFFFSIPFLPICIFFLFHCTYYLFLHFFLCFVSFQNYVKILFLQIVVHLFFIIDAIDLISCTITLIALRLMVSKVKLFVHI